MKNVFKLKAIYRIAGIIAIAALIAFSMIACGDEGGPTGGGGGGGGSGSGGLTVTGLPNQNGDWSAYVLRQGETTTSGRDWAAKDEALATNSNRRGSTFALHIVGDSGVRYTGSGNRVVVLHDYTPSPSVYYVGTANFSNGSATVPFSSFTQSPR